MSGIWWYVGLSYFLMFGAFFMSRVRKVHVTAMALVMGADSLIPIYIFTSRDWKKLLLEEGDILSPLLWMHLMLVITLYVLYVVQIQAGRQMLRGEMTLHHAHKMQGISILAVRVLVLLSAGLLIEPETVDG